MLSNPENFLANYNLSTREKLFAVFTLSGGALAKRHWNRSNDCLTTQAKWGHRMIALIETIPILGGLVALIETVVARCFYKLHLKYNVPAFLTFPQIHTLRLSHSTHESELPEYAGSIFQCVLKDHGYIVTRRNKGEPPPLNGKIIPITLKGPIVAQSNEGMKVRSFCLELLSNIEDLRNIRPEKEHIKLEELKNYIRDFLEMGALQKKAGFEDLIQLMKILQTEAKEYALTFKRFFELVDLQNKLPHKTERHVNRWDKIRTMVRSKLLVKTIVETAEHAKEIGLHPIPALPKKQTIVNLFPTLDAINLLESNHRNAGRWLMHHTKTITFRELCLSIKASCQQLRNSILKWDSYCLFTISGKSQEWMADLAYRYLPLEKMPEGILCLHQESAGEDIFTHLSKSTSKNFILIDDGAYSARQFYNYLDNLYLSLMRNGALKDTKNIYFIFGHFPENKFIEANFNKFEKFNVKIHIISNHVTKNCQSLMESENLSPDLQKQIKDLVDIQRPQLATEWKRPDFFSTSLFISEGYLNNLGRANYGELNFEEQSIERIHGIGPLMKVVPPYAKSDIH